MSLIRKALEGNSNVTILAPSSEAELEAFEQTLPGPIPEEIRTLLRFAKGFDIKGASVHFTGESCRDEYDLESIALPRVVPILNDVCGDAWAADIHSDGSWNNVFFLSHDPPLVFNQFESLDAFVMAFINREIDPSNIRRDWLDKVSKIGDGLSRADAVSSSDVSLRAFAESVPEDYRIHDLRSGSSLNSFELDLGQEIRRYGDELLFAVQDAKPKPSLFARIKSFFK